MKIAYGYTIEEKDDPFVRNAEISGANFAKSTTPGWLVDLLPFCALLFFIIPSLLIALILLPSAPYLLVRHLPVWTPGATFLRQAAAWKKETDAMYDGAFDWFRRQMVSNKSSRAG